ncbi:PhnE/PtxC family ABC transporter permease [Clostridium pasteurianum]|uniref:ABC-type phosphate/phosphonate transport system, permease component n=1 Tax=Clostridium pasteurianum BC1 TaxID=86416 RepID=R4K6X8_CLOPA|nr:ABC transporter permease subunit [Clostridium pasteurianum]AGK98318.1 ABC-type phosphate/phosphonate transport system, permease component [Clostridium pasteurianum BC1]
MEMSNSSKINTNTDLEKHINRTKAGKIKIKSAGLSQKVIKVTLITLAILTIYGFLTFDYKDLNFGSAVVQTLQNIKVMFLQPKLTHFTLLQGFQDVVITLALAFLTTLFGGVFALFLGLFAARNLSNAYVSNFIRTFVAFIRAIPSVLWVLIFAVAAGLGSVAAVIGLTFHSIAYLIKAYSESYEEIDEGVIEALKASGANWWQIVFQAIFPSTVTYLIAWTFMRFEINFTNAVAMGAAAGAGGIGYELFMSGAFYYNIREVGVISYLIIAFAIVLEFLSNRLKNRQF